MWCHNISGYWLSLRIIGVESNMMAFNGLLCFALTTAAANVNNKDKISGKRKFASLANLSLLVLKTLGRWLLWTFLLQYKTAFVPSSSLLIVCIMVC